MTRDERVDGFIAAAQPFARPILDHIRALVHATIPDVGEAIKWGMPHFTLDGKNVCGMAAFKAHCSLIIEGAGPRDSGEGMGQFGKIESLDQLPPDAVLRELILARAARVRSGQKPPARPARDPKPEITMPDDFAQALTVAARAVFDRFTPAQRRDYLEWIVEAKRAETRASRIVTAAGWIAEGKKRNWKYEKC